MPPDQAMNKRRTWAVHVAVETPNILDDIAERLGCLRINGAGCRVGSTGVLLDKIATGQLILIPSQQ